MSHTYTENCRIAWMLINFGKIYKHIKKYKELILRQALIPESDYDNKNGYWQMYIYWNSQPYV